MKKRTKIILGIIFIILLILYLTIPSEADYYAWLEEKYGIIKSDKIYYYTQYGIEDGIEIFDRSSYQRNFGIFTTRKQNFEYLKYGDLEGEGFTIRLLGIGKKFFEIEEENLIWKILNK